MAKERLTKRTVDEAMEWAKKEHNKRSQDWTCLCQSFTRRCWLLDPFGSSATNAWNGQGGKWKHQNNGKPLDPDFLEAIPRGAMIYSTAGKYGHAVIASKTTTWTVDAKRKGYIDHGARDMGYWPSVRKEVQGWLCGATINGVDWYLNLGQPCGFAKHVGKHGD